MFKSSARPSRRKQQDRSEIPVSFLPDGNKPARIAYICALLGLIPGVGLILGWPALIFGTLGMRFARRDEHQRGLGHSRVSQIAGLAEILFQSLGAFLLASGLGWI